MSDAPGVMGNPLSMTTRRRNTRLPGVLPERLSSNTHRIEPLEQEPEDRDRAAATPVIPAMLITSATT